MDDKAEAWARKRFEDNRKLPPCETDAQHIEWVIQEFVSAYRAGYQAGMVDAHKKETVQENE